MIGSFMLPTNAYAYSSKNRGANAVDKTSYFYFEIRGGPKGNSKVRLRLDRTGGASTFNSMLTNPSTWKVQIYSGTNNHNIQLDSTSITTKKDINGEYLILNIPVSYEMPAYYKYKDMFRDAPNLGHRFGFNYYHATESRPNSAAETGKAQSTVSRRSINLELNSSMIGLRTADKVMYWNTTLGFNIWRQQYTVKFLPNGGSGSMANQVWDYGFAQNLRPNTFSKPGHHFKYWKVYRDYDNKWAWADGHGNGDYWQSPEPFGNDIRNYNDKANCATTSPGGTVYMYAQWEPNMYYLDVNGLLDGTSSGGISGYGTFDVYINGSLVANDVSDYYTSHPYGSTYQISDIRPATGRTYNGVSSGAISGTVDGTKTVQLKFTTNSYTLTINPNGGIWNGSSSTQSFTQKYGTTKSIDKPTRAGYIFGGWLFSGSGGMNGLATVDPTFKSSSGNVSVYNNAGGGTVTHSRVNSQSDNPSGSPYEIRISTNGTASPGLGGFVQWMNSGPNKKFIHTFIAKIPVGYTVSDYRNPIGDGGYSRWLTSKTGTGKWETYAYEINCGSSGSFSSFGHVALSSGNKTVTWYLAQSQITEVTSANSFNYGVGNCTLTATWVPNSFTNTIAHWMFGFKNSEGNNGNKSAFRITTTTFDINFGQTYMMDKSRGVNSPKGFYLCDTFGTSSISGSWATYNMGTTVTQKSNPMNYEYDYAPYNYKITYNLNGGTNHSSNPSTYNILYGVTLENPSRPGWKFNGWEINGQKVTGINPGANATFTNESDMRNKLNSRTIGDVTITATWLPIPEFNIPNMNNPDNNPIKPFISNGKLVIQLGDTFTPLKYVSATDKIDGDISQEVIVESNEVPMRDGKAIQSGEYEVIYKVTNTSGVSANATLIVIVNQPPMITGPEVRHKLVHETIDESFLLSQQIAKDKEDSNITPKLGVKKIKDDEGRILSDSSQIDTRYVSNYEITISVTDKYKKTVDKTYTLKIVKDDYKYEESHDTEFRFINDKYKETLSSDSSFSVNSELNQILTKSFKKTKNSAQKIIKFNMEEINDVKDFQKTVKNETKGSINSIFVNTFLK